METLVRKIERKSIIVGIIGLGYVGFPLACAFLTADSYGEETSSCEKCGRRYNKNGLVVVEITS